MSRRRTASVVLVVLVVLGITLLPRGGATLGVDPVRAPVAPRVEDPQVLLISLDGLNTRAITPRRAAQVPHLRRLFTEGAGTLNARTQVELTVTLPNHTSMVTGRRIDKTKGGHGVTWNDDRPGTVSGAAGHFVASVFSALHAKGLSAAVFASKTKFDLFDRSWPTGVDRSFLRDERDALVTSTAIDDLSTKDRAFTFLHLAAADKAGHRYGWMGPEYLAAVTVLDRLVGRVLAAAETDPALADLVIIVTADHGGLPGTHRHIDRTKLDNYRIPFVVWGPGVAHRNLYDLNPGYRDPGTKQPPLTGRQPIRNGNVANLALDLLGYGPVPGSRFGRTTPIRVSAPPA